MQTKDNQQFAFTQSWILNRTGGSNKRIIYRVTIDDTYPLYCGGTSCQSIPSITENKTSEFLARMSSGYTTLTVDDADGKSFTAKEFTTWASDDGLVSNGMFTHEVGLEEKSYTATVTPTFVGNSATESGEITSNFVQRIGYKYYTGLFQYKYRHFHVNSTVTVTDVRQLIGAVEDAENFDKTLGESQQGVVDEFTNGLKDVVNNAQTKADYTDYNNAKSEADSLVNDDGNGNPIYDEDAFNAYKEAVNNIDNALNKDLPKSEQSVVDEATGALNNALNTLESSRYYTVTFLDAEGNILTSERLVSGAAFGTIVAPALPEGTDEIAVCGWAYENDVLAGADDVLTSDVTVKVAAEDKVLRIFNESGFAFDAATGYIVTESRSLTVADVLAKFDNDASVLVIKDFNGNVLSADDYVGSGATVTLESKYCDGVTYESRTFVVYGDVNGDGLVNADDYAISRQATIDRSYYNENNHYFFVANDIAKDGYIDAIDTHYLNLMVRGYR